MEKKEPFRTEQEKWEYENLSPYAKKSVNAIRWQDENPDFYRTEYQRDVGRILYSNSFRRLRMKTQVFKAKGSDPHNRTRLTHSLEVSQIARSIARPLKLNLDLTEAIALGHDLGHTPYGHAGEQALQECLSGKMTFNHNVQSVWILRSTLCKRTNKKGDPYPGYNLTHDVVEGVLKHTKCNNIQNEISQIEYYHPDKPGSLEGQVVDKADGIAYIKHDIDDGIRNGLITLNDFKEIWLESTDLPFDHNWIDNIILDIIKHSQNKDKIEFGPHINDLYKSIKNFIFERIISSPMIHSIDQEGIEKINTIYEFCNHNPEFILNKNRKINQYKFDVLGVDRMIIDYIQWLGDENADNTYNRIINNLNTSSVVEDLNDFYEEEELPY